MEPVYRTVIAGVVGMFRLFGWRILVQGAEHVPVAGPAVIASNHVGYLDFTFIGYGARPQGRLVRFLAKKEVFDRPVVGWVMRAMRHIPVDRFGRASDSYDSAVEALRGGEVVGMFPESTISTSFVPRQAKTGSARMAMTAGAPLVPCAVWGSQRLLTKNRPRNLQRGVAVSVVYGPPVPYAADDSPAEVTDRLMEAMGALLEQAQASYPQVPAGDEDRWWLPAHLGGTAPTVEEADALALRVAQERREKRRRTNT